MFEKYGAQTMQMRRIVMYKENIPIMYAVGKRFSDLIFCPSEEKKAMQMRTFSSLANILIQIAVIINQNYSPAFSLHHCVMFEYRERIFNINIGLQADTNTKKKMKAVIVDDEKDLCFLLECILKKEEFDTVSLNSLEEADRKLKDLDPAVIFLDNQLPDGLGIKFIPKIKEALPKAKVVVMTAFHTTGDKNEALKYGADQFLKKPLSRIIIEHTLSELQLI